MGAQFDRIAAGGLPTSTERRLKELTAWGGFSSFLSAPEFVVAESVGIDPVGQVVGIAAGFVRPGYVRWADRWGRAVALETGRGLAQSASRLEGARWQRHPQIVLGWDALRRRALARLTD
jgi:hypothetical protein